MGGSRPGDSGVMNTAGWEVQADYAAIDFLPGFAVALPVKGFGEANPRGDPQGHFGAVYQAWNVKSRRARGTKQLQSCRAWDGTSAVL